MALPRLLSLLYRGVVFLSSECQLKHRLVSFFSKPYFSCTLSPSPVDVSVPVTTIVTLLSLILPPARALPPYSIKTVCQGSPAHIFSASLLTALFIAVTYAQPAATANVTLSSFIKFAPSALGSLLFLLCFSLFICVLLL